jgi:hypothetical protein
MKAYWINATEQTITAVDYAAVTDIQRMVGGYIEAPKRWPTGDVLFVDEAGMLKANPPGWFMIEGISQPIAGNGVVVGREIGDTSRTRDPKLTLEQLRAEVRFFTAQQVQAWARANSSEPAVSITDLNTGHTEVLLRTGRLFGEHPEKPIEDVKGHHQ